MPEIHQFDMTVPGVLVGGGWSTAAEVAAMTPEQQQAALIADVQPLTNQPATFFEGLPVADLVGCAAVIAFLRSALGAGVDTYLRTRSTVDQRADLIEWIASKEGLSQDMLATIDSASLVQFAFAFQFIGQLNPNFAQVSIQPGAIDETQLTPDDDCNYVFDVINLSGMTLKDLVFQITVPGTVTSKLVFEIAESFETWGRGYLLPVAGPLPRRAPDGLSPGQLTVSFPVSTDPDAPEGTFAFVIQLVSFTLVADPHNVAYGSSDPQSITVAPD